MSSTDLDDYLKKVDELAKNFDDPLARFFGQDRLSRFKRHRAGECQPESCEYRH